MFQENRSYSLWVTTFDGSIPQRTEVIATITDNTGLRPQLPHPPPFALPKYPINFNQKPPISHLPYPPKQSTTLKTTKATELYEESTVPDNDVISSTLPPPKMPEDVPSSEKTGDDDMKKPNSTIQAEPSAGSDMPFTVISLVAIGGLVVVVTAVIIFVWKKNSGQKKKSKKEDMVGIIYYYIISI